MDEIDPSATAGTGRAPTSPPAPYPGGSSGSPTDFLTGVLGKLVVVHGPTDLRGGLVTTEVSHDTNILELFNSSSNRSRPVLYISAAKAL